MTTRVPRRRNVGSAIHPVYTTPQPNETILLYGGPLEVEQAGVRIATEGSIELVWLRNPAIKFNFRDENPASTSLLINFTDGRVLLYLPICASPVAANLLSRGIISDARGRRIDFSGNVLEPICVGMKQNISHLLLHLPNFHDTLGAGIGIQQRSWLGRFLLEADGWRVTVDKVENYADLYIALKGTGGYAITHVIKIEREDGSAFNIDHAEPLIDDLFYFLSFARGYWVSPVLEVGFDVSGSRIWERWVRPRTDTWRVVGSWFDSHRPQRLTHFWPSFYGRIHDAVWGEALRRAIRWYVASNLKAGELEGALILAQTGHELLAWTRFVTEKGLTTEGFDKLPASDKIRLILLDAKIPTSVPASLQFLTVLCQSERWIDGPHAVTQLRNRLVHSNPKNFQRWIQTGADELQDAHILSMWYLELALLYLLGYEDEYASRLIYVRALGQVEPVPWQLPSP